MDFLEEEIYIDGIIPIGENFELSEVQESNFLFNQRRNRQLNDYNMEADSPSQKNSEEQQINYCYSPSTDSDFSSFGQRLKSQKLASQKQDGLNPKRTKQSKRIGKTPKNDTKNIPKNFGKAIIAFILKKQQIVQKVLQHHGVDYESLAEELIKKKKNFNTIADLRKLWTEHKHAKCLRVLSDIFLRKHSMHYIFNSRVWNYKSHIKYLRRMREALSCPESFSYIKNF